MNKKLGRKRVKNYNIYAITVTITVVGFDYVCLLLLTSLITIWKCRVIIVLYGYKYFNLFLSVICFKTRQKHE